MNKNETMDFTSKNGAESRVNIFCFDPFKLVIVEESPEHALFDERATQAPPGWFVNSVIVSGVIAPIEVRKAGEDKKGIAHNEVVDGRQRVLSARIATERMKRMQDLLKKGASGARLAEEFGVDVETTLIWLDAFKARSWEPYTVNGIRVSGDPNKMRTMVVELNGHIEDGPIVKAKKYARLLEYGVAEHRAQIASGISRAQAKSYLALLECSAPVQRAVESGKVAPSVATKLASLPAAEQSRALDEMIAAGATKGSAAANAVKQAARGEKVTREAPEEWVLNGHGLVKLSGAPPKGMKRKTLRVWMAES